MTLVTLYRLGPAYPAGPGPNKAGDQISCQKGLNGQALGFIYWCLRGIGRVNTGTIIGVCI